MATKAMNKMGTSTAARVGAGAATGMATKMRSWKVTRAGTQMGAKTATPLGAGAATKMRTSVGARTGSGAMATRMGAKMAPETGWLWWGRVSSRPVGQSARPCFGDIPKRRRPTARAAYE
jgi:hypothetical protein